MTLALANHPSQRRCAVVIVAGVITTLRGSAVDKAIILEVVDVNGKTSTSFVVHFAPKGGVNDNTCTQLGLR